MDNTTATCKRSTHDMHWCSTHRAEWAEGATMCIRQARQPLPASVGVLWTPAGPAYPTRKGR